MGIGTSSSSPGRTSAPARGSAYAVNRDASELRRSPCCKAAIPPGSAANDPSRPMHVIFWSAAPGGGPALARPTGGARARRRPPRSGPHLGWAQAGVGGHLFLGPGEDLLGELVGAVRPGPGRHQSLQAGGLQRRGRRVVRRPGVAERCCRLGDRGAAGPDLPYHLVLDLHRVRASKKSLARNSGSVTCSGCGFRQRVSASAASLGSGLLCRLAMPPPHPDDCKDDLCRSW